MSGSQKRDMELIRKLFLNLEAGKGLDLEGYEESILLYHIYLMEDAGFIEATFLRDHVGEIANAHVQEITWAGQEFLNAIRDANAFKKAVREVGRVGGALTLGLLKEYIEMMARQKLGLPPGG